MKRLISLAAILLALSLALCACGDKDTDPVEDTQGSSSEQSSQTDTQGSSEDEGQGADVGGVDLTALKDQYLSDYNYTDVMNVETVGLGNLYGIDTSKVVASASFTSTQGGAFPHEVVMVQATDAAAATEMQNALMAHLDDIAQQAASYDPESQALAESCGVVVYDTYVGMFFTDHCSDMTETFKAAVS